MRSTQAVLKTVLPHATFRPFTDTMSHLSVQMISRDTKPDSEWEKYALRMRPLRLKSLKSDPECFISQHDSEINQPMSFWTGRLKGSAAYHFVLVRAPNDNPVQSPEDLLRDDVEWMGFNACLDLRVLSKATIQNEGNAAMVKPSQWYLAAVWVDKEVRGKGSGRMLIQNTVDTMKEIERKNGITDSTCIVGVMHGNNRALHLYESVGFKIVNPNAVEEKEGRKFDVTELQMVL